MSIIKCKRKFNLSVGLLKMWYSFRWIVVRVSREFMFESIKIFNIDLFPTNAPLYYTYKMLKYTVKTSHYRSYMFRSIRTIIRKPMPNLARVTMFFKRYVVKCSAMSVKVFQVVVCTVCCAVCDLILSHVNSAHVNVPKYYLYTYIVCLVHLWIKTMK